MKQPRIQGILGATGSGKTTFMRTLLNDHFRTFVIDPTADDEKFRSYGTLAPTMADVVRLSTSRTFRVRIITEDPIAFQFVCWLAWQRGNCTLAVDEVHEFVPNMHNGIPRIFKLLCLRGRHRDVSIIATSQRPQNVHKDFLSEAANHGLYVFRMNDPYAFDTLRKIIPDVDKARNLPIGEKLSWPPLPRSRSVRNVSKRN